MADVEHDNYALRLPPGMRDRIRRAAEDNRRSMNSQIVYLLDRALPPEGDRRKEAWLSDEAWRRGYAMKRTEGGYVITSKRGDGYVAATPGSLEEVAEFLKAIDEKKATSATHEVAE